MANMLKFLLLGFHVLLLTAQDLVTLCEGEDDCCDGILCGMNEGDCDSHEDCAGHLRCGVDNCEGDSFDSTDDCCWEDPLFLPTSTTIGFGKCQNLRGFEIRIRQAAVTQGCVLPKKSLDSISMEDCSRISCSAELLGKSFTCDNQNKEQICEELTTLLDAMETILATQCTSTMLRQGGECTNAEVTATCANFAYLNTYRLFAIENVGGTYYGKCVSNHCTGTNDCPDDYLTQCCNACNGMSSPSFTCKYVNAQDDSAVSANACST